MNSSVIDLISARYRTGSSLSSRAASQAPARINAQTRVCWSSALSSWPRLEQPGLDLLPGRCLNLPEQGVEARRVDHDAPSCGAGGGIPPGRGLILANRGEDDRAAEIKIPRSFKLPRAAPGVLEVVATLGGVEALAPILWHERNGAPATMALGEGAAQRPSTALATLPWPPQPDVLEPLPTVDADGCERVTRTRVGEGRLGSVPGGVVAGAGVVSNSVELWREHFTAPLAGPLGRRHHHCREFHRCGRRGACGLRPVVERLHLACSAPLVMLRS